MLLTAIQEMSYTDKQFQFNGNRIACQSVTCLKSHLFIFINFDICRTNFIISILHTVLGEFHKKQQKNQNKQWVYFPKLSD